MRISLIRVAHFPEKKKIKQRLLAALSFVIPKCRSYLLTPSSARWATSRRLLPSTANRRLDIRLQILESLSQKCRFKMGKVVEHSRNYVFLFFYGLIIQQSPHFFKYDLSSSRRKSFPAKTLAFFSKRSYTRVNFQHRNFKRKDFNYEPLRSRYRKSDFILPSLPAPV